MSGTAKEKLRVSDKRRVLPVVLGRQEGRAAIADSPFRAGVADIGAIGVVSARFTHRADVIKGRGRVPSDLFGSSRTG